MDVTVVGAGIIGCSAAAFLAEGGANVTVVERGGVAAGASGRNSGVLQDPLDDRTAGLHAATLALHREVADLRDEPDGILVLGASDPAAFPDRVRPEAVEDAAAVEPLVREGLPAVRLRTGWVVGPATLTQAWWRRAEAAGARLVVGDDRPRGDVTLHATGAWTAGVSPLWGVTARVRTRVPVGHVLEEAMGSLLDGADGVFFSLVGDVLGSSFAAEEPDPEIVRRSLEEHAHRFVGAVDVTGARACPRPQSPDGLPLAGRIDDRTFVCAGHGAWGISVGPATARMVARAMLGGAPPPAEYDPLRFSR